MWCGCVLGVVQLPARMQTLHSMLHTPAAQPHVVYAHCTAGCDRTGEFIGAYRMAFQGKNATGIVVSD
jgi:protein-tyrosine phosphatase